jgi:frataxin
MSSSTSTAFIPHGDNSRYQNQQQRNNSNSNSSKPLPFLHPVANLTTMTMTTTTTTTATTTTRTRTNNILVPKARCFHSESDYHNVADQTLHAIQDTLDFYFEDNPSLSTSSPDITYASGVLTIALSQGTWVLNKQTPNRQIWWSSPISGPRRYEYDEESQKWIWTRLVNPVDSDSSSSSSSDGSNSSSSGSSSPTTCKDEIKYLGEALKKEMVDIFHLENGLEDLDAL